MESNLTVMTGEFLTVGYVAKSNRKVVCSGMNFQLNRGELVCLLGANGVGKSTLLRTLAAIQPPLFGNLTLSGRLLGSYTARERSRLIAIVLTTHTQAGGLTVRELVALGRQPYTGFLGRLMKGDEEKIDKALYDVGIADKEQRYVAELSDGERQKVMIAKALVQESPLVLLDEPTAFLDVVSRIEIMNLLHRLAIEENRAILLSTHDVEQALLLADKLWLMPESGGLYCGVTEDLVLANRMEGLFPSTETKFDMLHGLYSPILHENRKLSLSVSDRVLEHWTRNALTRNGWFVENGITDIERCPRLEVCSATDFRLSFNGRTEILSSFQLMLERLKDICTE